MAEHASLPEAHLWWHKQEPGFLLKKLRRGDRGAHRARSWASSPTAGGGEPLTDGAGARAWLENGQENAYRACLGGRMHLVWGPPGTGKTRVLRSAIGDLLAADKRICSCPAPTSPWRERALHETLKERQFAPGEIVRGGPGGYPEIANDPRVSLPLMVGDPCWPRWSRSGARRPGTFGK